MELGQSQPQQFPQVILKHQQMAGLSENTEAKPKKFTFKEKGDVVMKPAPLQTLKVPKFKVTPSTTIYDL